MGDGWLEKMRPGAMGIKTCVYKIKKADFLKKSAFLLSLEWEIVIGFK